MPSVEASVPSVEASLPLEASIICHDSVHDPEYCHKVPILYLTPLEIESRQGAVAATIFEGRGRTAVQDQSRRRVVLSVSLLKQTTTSIYSRPQVVSIVFMRILAD